MAKYHVPVLEKFQWQQPVLDKDLTSPPAEPSKGDRYLIYGTGSGDWSGHDSEIAYYDGAAWQFITASEGMHVWVKDEDKVYVYDGTSWSLEGTGTGDMLKSTYDTDDDGIVDKAESVDDGTYSSTAQDVKDAVDKKHTQGTDTTLGTMAADINMNTHKLINLSVPTTSGDSIRATAKITEANLEDAIDKKPSYVTEYEALEFDNM